MLSHKRCQSSWMSFLVKNIHQTHYKPKWVIHWLTFAKSKPDTQLNPFGTSKDDEDNYWVLQDSAAPLLDSFQSLGQQGDFLSTQTARYIFVKARLNKDQLRQIWNASDIDRDEHFNLHNYFL